MGKIATKKKVQDWKAKNNFKEVKICGFCGHRTFEGTQCWCLTLMKECGVKIDDAEVSFDGGCDRWVKYEPFAIPKS